MTRRLTKRYFVHNLDELNLSSPLRYERYYINDNLRIQTKNNVYEKEELNNQNEVILKVVITEEEFNNLKPKAYKKIIRDSYLYLDDDRISIKIYYADYEGLNRVEVKFSSEEEMQNYKPLPWMEQEMTDSPLAFDVYLSKLTPSEFIIELQKYIN